jgi:hypothetical protein
MSKSKPEKITPSLYELYLLDSDNVSRRWHFYLYKLIVLAKKVWIEP